MKKILALLLAAPMAMSATTCSSGVVTSSAILVFSGETSSAAKADFKAPMVTDTGGVNDQPFNQLSWKGLQKLRVDNDVGISYTESKQEVDYATNLGKTVDNENDLVWGVGFAMGNAILNATKVSPDVWFAVADNAYEETPSSLTAIVFRTQELSFLVDYVAAKTTKTSRVGSVGGAKSDVIDQFECSCKVDVTYGVKEMDKTVKVVARYAESSIDFAKGKAITSKMLSGGHDTVFHAAGNVGTGIIETAKEANKYAIGVDKDQTSLTPSNVLTSALKKTDKAVEEVPKEIMDDETIGGTTISLGVKEEAAGIPEEHKLMGGGTYKAAAALQDQIKDGRLVPPVSEEDYNTLAKNLE